jgi:hypothetical protein
MANGRIVIKKWKILLRKFFEGSPSSAGRFRTWWQQLTARWSSDKSYQVLDISGREDKTSDLPERPSRPPIRIRGQSGQRGANTSSPVLPRAGGDASGTRTRRRRTGLINVGGGTLTCLACQTPILTNQKRAQCQQNHVIHEHCVEFVKHKCPTCKGQIASAANTNRILVNADTDKLMCPACTAEIIGADATARCANDVAHVIHRRCTNLVKNQCPTCRGFIG